MATTLDFDLLRSDGPPEAAIEMMYINEYLKDRGYTQRDLDKLPPEQARQLRIEASKYASTRLAQLEIVSDMMQGIQGNEASHYIKSKAAEQEARSGLGREKHDQK